MVHFTVMQLLACSSLASAQWWNNNQPGPAKDSKPPPAAPPPPVNSPKGWGGLGLPRSSPSPTLGGSGWGRPGPDTKAPSPAAANLWPSQGKATQAPPWSTAPSSPVIQDPWGQPKPSPKPIPEPEYDDEEELTTINPSPKSGSSSAAKKKGNRGNNRPNPKSNPSPAPLVKSWPAPEAPKPVQHAPTPSRAPTPSPSLAPSPSHTPSPSPAPAPSPTTAPSQAPLAPAEPQCVISIFIYSTSGLPAITRMQTRTQLVPSVFTTMELGPVQEVIIEEDDQNVLRTVTRTVTKTHAVIKYTTSEIVKTRTVIEGGGEGGHVTSTATQCK